MIYIGFGTNNRLKSRLTRWATGSKWSHVWIEYRSELWNGIWAVHSHKHGVVKVPIDRVYSEYTRRRVYKCVVPIDDGITWARKRVGLKYDYGVIWNGLLLVLYGLLRWKFLWNMVVRDASKMSCSEFVGGFMKAAGVAGTEEIDPELTTPGMLEAICAESESCRPLGRAVSQDTLPRTHL